MKHKKIKKLAIFGTGAFADLAFHYFNEDSIYQVVTYIVDDDLYEIQNLNGVRVLKKSEFLKEFDKSGIEIFIAVGYTKLNRVRSEKYEEFKALGYQFASYIHSKIKIWNTNTIGENTFIFENNTIQPYVEIGNNVVLWSGNHVGHHSKIGNHTFITSHVVISGYVNIEEYCFFGVNSTIRDSIKISKYSIIGAGTLILKDTDEKSLYIGSKSIPINKKSTTVRKI